MLVASRSTPLITALFLVACSDAGVTKFNADPTAELTSHASGDTVQEGALVSLRGGVGDPNHRSEQLAVTWVVDGVAVCPESAPASDGAVACEVVLDEGGGSIQLEVRDPEGATGAAQLQLEVTPTDAPTADIATPTAEDKLYAGELVTFTGTVADTEDDAADLSVVWESSLDGDLAGGMDAPDSEGGLLGATALTEGEHFITLTATDSSGKEGRDSVTVTVGPPNSAPTCGITAPADGSAGGVGETVLLQGTAEDVDVPSDWLDAAWSSDRDGALGSSTPTTAGAVTLAADALSAATHVLTLTVTDELGETCTDAVVYTVGTAPSVTWTSPADGDVVQAGESVAFAATVSDGEDAATALSVAWSSDVDGVLSTAGADATGAAGFSTSTLSGGDHVLGLEVTDTAGMSAVLSRSLSVNRAPTVDSVSISPSTATADDTVTCSATGSDGDGDTVSFTYAWSDGAGATLGSAASLDLSTVAVTGGDTVTCTATADDGRGGTASDSADLTLGNRAPTVASVTLSPTSPATDDTLTASATTADADGDTLTVTYDWTVDGTLVQSGTSPTLDGGTWFDRDEVVEVTVTADDGIDTASDAASVTVANTAPTAPVVSVDPSAAGPGEDLVCTVDTVSTDADADAVTYSVTWEVDGVAYVAGGTSDTGGLDSGDPGWMGPDTTTWTDDTVDGDDTVVGEVWTCTMTPTDGTDDGPTASASVTISNPYGSGTVDHTASGVDFVTVYAGTFDMGCTTAQSATGHCYPDESPVNSITLTNDYYVSQTEITRAQFQAVMGYVSSFHASCGSTCPITAVDWHEAAAFTNAMSSAAGLTQCYTCTGSGTSVSCSYSVTPYSCDGYRLPTEAEWENAARCGTDQVYAGSDTITDVAWYYLNTSSSLQPVGGLDPNGCALYDMSGNVYEFSHDTYRSSYYSTTITSTDPYWESTTSFRTKRGGGYRQASQQCRVSRRQFDTHSTATSDVGFRVVRLVP